MTRRGRIVLKVSVWIACLGPLAWLGWRIWTGDLGANPVSFITNSLGQWSMRILLTTLALTPLRILFGLGWPVTLRRLLGLFAFLYVSLHFLVWIVVDHFFAWREMGADIVKRPYITVGFTGFALLIPLALTSTAGMVKRLGGRRWRQLHRLVYVTGVLAVVHFLWLAKVGRRQQYVYAAVLVGFLGVRAIDAFRRAAARRTARSRVPGAAMARTP